MITVTSFAILLRVAASTWSRVEVGQAIALELSACALLVLAWQIARRRLAPGAHLVTRGVAGLGLVLLALCYGGLALRLLGALAPPVGLEEMAGLAAALTADLWIDSAVVILAAVSHGVFWLVRPQPRVA
jgi:hypothetical protein